MRQRSPFSTPEASLYPFGPRQHIAPSKPHRQIDHQEYLVEHRPQPRNPQALEPVGKSPIDHQHGSGNVEHARRIGQSEHIERERFAP